ncbi:MAG: RNB domain-containing ribonuclease [Treponema sp.]|jgi:exoribonuclease-2|nr:RNB domain-containing ribonuclease [Treponema sp.]
MFNEKSLVLYKTRPALVTAIGDKIDISVFGGEKLKVREKDVELLHPGPCVSLDLHEAPPADSVREAWELLRETANGGTSTLKELAELVSGSFTPQSAWGAYQLLQDGLFFTGTIAALRARPIAEVEAEEKKRAIKKQEGREREAFLEQIKNHTLHFSAGGLEGQKSDDVSPQAVFRRFLYDVEALALGKSEKSRTMKDLGLSETPEDAHALLLECGFWTPFVNPHPARCGVSTVSAAVIPDPPPVEERRDLTDLPAFAIDSPWSNDPDDAVSVEIDAAGSEGSGAPGSAVLYVHVADPASSIIIDGSAEKEARDRGATLYLPEGSSRMLADECLSLFALGLTDDPSPALTFKITLDEKGEIAETEIFPSLVQVTRLTYADADEIIKSGAGLPVNAAAGVKPVLQKLCRIAERNLERRLDVGAINIELPETHISVNKTDGKVTIEPIVSYRSAEMVRECMLLAGEGAGLWAERQESADRKPWLAFPYVAQEAGDIPNEILSGMAGSYQLRRCMRPRSLSGKPGRHWGLGLDTYTQVTSPLRRYTDLLAHLQIRSLLRGGTPLNAEELLARLAAGEAGAQATVQAERASRAHWTAVYLSGKKDSVWEAIVLEKKGPRWVCMISALALETQVALKSDIKPNDTVKLVLKSVNIPRCEAIFSQAE